MFDAKGLLDSLVRSGAAGGFAGGLAGGALANVLSGKKAKKFAGSALKVGGLAYKAWRSYQQHGDSAPDPAFEAPPAGSALLPAADDDEGNNSLSLLLARAMISAAKADGQIDTGRARRY